MKKKIYSSYDEIDLDLEILDLERKLHYQKAKRSIGDLKDNLTIGKVAQGVLGISGGAKPLVKTAFRAALPFLVKKAFGLFSKK